MATFILDNRGLKVEIDSFDCILKGQFSSEIIAIAESQYGARVTRWKKTNTVNQTSFTFL
jgi:hypothetical protein